VKPYAELLEFNQPSPIRAKGFTRIRDTYPELSAHIGGSTGSVDEGIVLYSMKDPERIVEFAGRVDYGPKNSAKLGTDKSIISRWIDSGHHSMLEMAEATFFIECSRVVSHELVRHRLCNFQQESQRFVKYDDASEDCFYVPDGEYGPDIEAQVGNALNVYKNMRKKGVPAQLARYVLPNSMGTRLIMKANLREWRHVVSLRTAKAAQPEMQELAWQIHDQLVEAFPNIMYKATEAEEVR
jgi:thymidylate synthase (FAD)